MKITYQNKIFNESGIASILVLGFLSIILCLVLVFINLSLINKKISESYDSVQIARLAAKTAYQRALMGINAHRSNPSGTLQQIFSYNSEDYPGRSDELDTLLETTIEGITYFSGYSESEGPHWSYLPLNTEHSEDTPINSRFAYAVIVETGKLDPSASVDSGENAFLAPGSIDAVSETETNTTGTKPDGAEVTGRPGRDLNEVFLSSLPVWLTNTYVEKMSTTNANPAGLLPYGSRWADFDELFSSLNIVDDDIKDSFRNVFVMNNLPDAEAFWSDNGDQQRENAELYHRFNLARSDWNNIEVDSILSDPILFNESTSESDIYSIQWIANWKTSGDFPDISACQNQIAANLIDYCDSNFFATTDDENSPTYVGLEKTPYINEVQLIISGEVQEIGGTNPGTQSQYICSVNIESITAELVNMYDNSSTVTPEVTVSGKYRWQPGTAGTELWRTFNNSTTLPNVTITDKGYYTTSSVSAIDISPTENMNFDQAKSLTRLIDSLEITDISVKLKSTANDFFDYSYVVDSNVDTESFELSSNGDSERLYIDYQIDDPRQNLLSTDWGGIAAVDNVDTGTLGSRNFSSIFNPDPGGDTDSEPFANDPWEISTSFIRNEPMQSPWELGFIHRGKKWQTLNLKRYNSVEEMKGGGSDYFRGDANILDQIKMTSNIKTYGKININTDSIDVLKALFEKIHISSDSETDSSQKTPGYLTNYEVDSTNAESIANVLLNSNGTLGGNVYLTRGQIVREIDAASIINTICNASITDNSLTRETDASQEEFIGKFVNLTKATYSNYYYIIAIAQTIKDVKKANNNYGEYVAGEDQILSTQKILVTIQWDEQNEVFNIIKYQFLSD